MHLDEELKGNKASSHFDYDWITAIGKYMCKQKEIGTNTFFLCVMQILVQRGQNIQLLT